MYDPALDVFVLAAELGSFSRAAEKSFITPSAVIQKINRLENDLNVRLFDRTPQGVTLTPAGEYLLTESRALIERCRDIRSHLAGYACRLDETVLFGMNQIHVARLIYDLWPEYSEWDPGVTLSSYTFGQAADDVRPDTDLIEGICYNEPSWQKRFTFCPVTYTRLSLLVSQDSPLAECPVLTPELLNGVTLAAILRGASPEYDRLTDDLRSRGFAVEEYGTLSPPVIIRCLEAGKPVVIHNCWRDPHPHGRVVPFLPEYRVPYGFFLSRTASPAARRFIDFLKKRPTAVEPL